MVLLQATEAEITQLELARSKYSFAENIELVIETRLEQKNSSRFMTITCYSEADFTVKKLEEPVLKINQVPGAKILEVRKTLSEIMLVLAEYTRDNSPKVEFNVSFQLYGAQFTINQKGFVHPQTNKHRLQRAQRGLINVNKAQLALDAAITTEQKQEAQKQLLRAQRDLDISKRELPKNTTGVVVTEIFEGSPLMFVSVNDVIVELQKKRVINSSQFSNLVKEIINKGATTLYLAIFNSSNQRSYITVKLK